MQGLSKVTLTRHLSDLFRILEDFEASIISMQLRSKPPRAQICCGWPEESPAPGNLQPNPRRGGVVGDISVALLQLSRHACAFVRSAHPGFNDLPRTFEQLNQWRPGSRVTEVALPLI